MLKVLMKDLLDKVHVFHPSYSCTINRHTVLYKISIVCWMGNFTILNLIHIHVLSCSDHLSDRLRIDVNDIQLYGGTCSDNASHGTEVIEQ